MYVPICTLAPDPTNIRGGFAHVSKTCMSFALPYTPFHSSA